MIYNSYPLVFFYEGQEGVNGMIDTAFDARTDSGGGEGSRWP